MCREKSKESMDTANYLKYHAHLQNLRTKNEEPIYISYTYIYRTSIYQTLKY